jgi:hypothetical protein
VADLGARGIFVLADFTEQAASDVKNFLEFRTLPAVERVDGTPVGVLFFVDAMIRKPSTSTVRGSGDPAARVVRAAGSACPTCSAHNTRDSSCQSPSLACPWHGE